MQSPYNVKEAGGSPLHPGFVGLSKRRKHIGIAIQLESRGRNSDNRVRFAVVVQRHANSMRIRTITLLPQTRADNDDRSRAELILLRLERAASY
jgi:hypothetical protein